MSEHLVHLPLGVVLVKLDRRGLGLGERGGFEARWADSEMGVMGLEAYRAVVKEHLKEVYRQQEGGEPGNITLNLASHQLIDDLVGWGKLNASSHLSTTT